MKKLVALLLAAVMVMSFGACTKSKAEQDLERARDTAKAAQDALDNAKNRYNDFQNDWNNYQSALDKLNNAK